MLVKAPSQLIGTLVQLLGMLPTGFLVDNVLCLANDLLGLFWMLTCDFFSLVDEVPQVFTDTHYPPNADIDHLLVTTGYPVAWRRYSRRTRLTQPAEEKLLNRWFVRNIHLLGGTP